jgi:hypothetical protein
MSQDAQDPEEAKKVQEVTVTGRFWFDVDVDEQEYLDRLARFGEGYFDFAVFSETGSGEAGFIQA